MKTSICLAVRTYFVHPLGAVIRSQRKIGLRQNKPLAMTFNAGRNSKGLFYPGRSGGTAPALRLYPSPPEEPWLVSQLSPRTVGGDEATTVPGSGMLLLRVDAVTLSQGERSSRTALQNAPQKPRTCPSNVPRAAALYS